MNAIELFHQNGKPAGVFYCEKCRTVNLSRGVAEQCCQNYRCDKCGKDTGSRTRLRCDLCMMKDDEEKELARFENAEKLTSWDGLVFDGSDFHASLEEFIDQWGYDHGDNDMPEYVWACKPKRFVKLDIADIMESLTDDAPEDWDWETLNGLKEFDEAIKKFIAANSDVRSYEPDYTKAVIIKKS